MEKYNPLAMACRGIVDLPPGGAGKPPSLSVVVPWFHPRMTSGTFRMDTH